MGASAAGQIVTQIAFACYHIKYFQHGKTISFHFAGSSLHSQAISNKSLLTKQKTHSLLASLCRPWLAHHYARC